MYELSTANIAPFVQGPPYSRSLPNLAGLVPCNECLGSAMLVGQVPASQPSQSELLALFRRFARPIALRAENDSGQTDYGNEDDQASSIGKQYHDRSEYQP